MVFLVLWCAFLVLYVYVCLLVEAIANRHHVKNHMYYISRMYIVKCIICFVIVICIIFIAYQYQMC